MGNGLLACSQYGHGPGAQLQIFCDLRLAALSGMQLCLGFLPLFRVFRPKFYCRQRLSLKSGHTRQHVDEKSLVFEFRLYVARGKRFHPLFGNGTDRRPHLRQRQLPLHRSLIRYKRLGGHLADALLFTRLHDGSRPRILLSYVGHGYWRTAC